jgi:U4/U6 small nuclear ribonucleoprotein PRP31
MLALDQGRTKILKYMEKRMQLIAPNVCAIVGPAIGAKLIAAAGGVTELAKMPACNIQVLGAHRKALHGLSTATVKIHRGFIAECEFVHVAPEPLQKNVIRMLSTKTALAARADMNGTATKGEIGQDLKVQIIERFKKIQAPKLPRMKRPLPKPDDKPRRKRAGKHLTAFRRRVQMTEYRKYENRMSFGPEPQKEYRETGRTFGMLKAKGTNKLKVRAEANQKILQKYNPTQKPLGESHTTGLSSSLVFTPVQGIQLYNPDYIADQIKEQKDLYFSSKAGFTTVTALKRAAPEPTKKIIF